MVRKIKMKENKAIDKDIKMLKMKAKLDENYKIHPLYGSYFNIAISLEYFIETQPIFEPAFGARIEGFIKCIRGILGDIDKYYIIDIILSMYVYQNTYSSIIKKLRKTKEHEEIEKKGYSPEALGISQEMYKHFNVIDVTHEYLKEFIDSKEILNSRDKEVLFDDTYMKKIQYTIDFIQEIVNEIDGMLNIDKDETVEEWNAR